MIISEIKKDQPLIGYRCGKCNLKDTCIKRLDNIKFPRLLPVTVKLFDNFGRKLGGGYNVNEKLNFEDDKPGYSLSSIIYHIGKSLCQGHYVTVSKTSDGFFLFNDDKVSYVL